MKTLYVSDLDGTLLDSQKNITEYTGKTLNTFIEKGGLFSIATARMPYGCEEKLSEIAFSVPVILMNGALLYNLRTKTAQQVQGLPPEIIEKIETVLENHKAPAFLYTIENSVISMFYKEEAALKAEQYFSTAAKKACAEISRVKSFFRAAANKIPFYFAMSGPEKELAPLQKAVSGVRGISAAYYLNVYNGLYCLEIASETATKASAVKRLMEFVGADELVCFGDNLNDLDMMRLAGRAYAPRNAIREVKDIALEILEDNDHDGVARFMAVEAELL